MRVLVTFNIQSFIFPKDAFTLDTWSSFDSGLSNFILVIKSSIGSYRFVLCLAFRILLISIRARSQNEISNFDWAVVFPRGLMHVNYSPCSTNNHPWDLHCFLLMRRKGNFHLKLFFTYHWCGGKKFQKHLFELYYLFWKKRGEFVKSYRSFIQCFRDDSIRKRNVHGLKKSGNTVSNQV